MYIIQKDAQNSCNYNLVQLVGLYAYYRIKRQRDYLN
jgi:hypothetical protein